MLRRGVLDIDFLMIVAALGAAYLGEWSEGAILLFLFSLSGALETFAMDRTRRAIEKLMALRPPVATVRRDGQEVEVPVEEVHIGEEVIVLSLWTGWSRMAFRPWTSPPLRVNPYL